MNVVLALQWLASPFISFQSLNYKCIDHQLISSARLQNYLLVVTANVPKAMMAPDRTTSWCNDVFKPDLAQFLATTRQTHWLAENTYAFLVNGVFMLSNFKNSCICLIFCINCSGRIRLAFNSHMWKKCGTYQSSIGTILVLPFSNYVSTYY